MGYTDVKYKFKKIGKNVEIGDNVYFRYPELVEIGDNVTIDEFCYFTTELKIGNYVHISPHCSVIGGRKGKLVLENYSGLAAGCRVVCCSDNLLGDGLTNPTIPEKYHSSVKYTQISIGAHAVVGTGCVIHPGISIGEGAVVGSMSLVTKDIEAWTINIGIPAKKVQNREKNTILEYQKQLESEKV